jgi:hypothetical protein
VPPGPATPVEAGVDIDVEGEGLLAAPAGRATDRDVEVSLGGLELLGEETAVGTETDTGLLEVSSLELDAGSLVHAPHGEHGTPHALDAVDLVLLLGEGSAERRIERTGESLLAHAVAGLVVDLVTAVLGLAAGRRRRRSVRGLVVTVGASNDNLEVIAGGASVGSRVLGNILSPDGALVVDDGRRVGARALVGVPLGVTLDEDVEASAGRGLVAELGARGDVVAVKGLVREVSVTVDRALEVDESLLVAGGGLGRDSQLLVRGVVVEAINGVILGRGTGTGGLRSTWVLGVDETAVGADLDGSRAGRVGGEGEGVGPVDGSARGRNDAVGGGRSLGGLSASNSRCSCGGSSLLSSGGCGGHAGLGSRVVVVLVPQPPEGALLEVISVPLGLGLSSGSAGNSRSSRNLGGRLLVSSLLGRADTDGRSLSEGSNGIKTSRVESLRSRAGGDEGGSPKDDCVTHSEWSICRTCVKRVEEGSSERV